MRAITRAIDRLNMKMIGRKKYCKQTVVLILVIAMALTMSSCGREQPSVSGDSDKISSEYTGGRYVYPVTPKDPEWKKLGNNVQMIKACQVPEDILERMSTVDVIDSAVHNPMIASIFVFEGYTGIEIYSEELNVLGEMFRRNDLDEELEYYGEHILEYIPENEEDAEFYWHVFETFYNYHFGSTGSNHKKFGMIYPEDVESTINGYYETPLKDHIGSDTVIKYVCDTTQTLVMDFGENTYQYDFGLIDRSIKGKFEFSDDMIIFTPDDGDPEYLLTVKNDVSSIYPMQYKTGNALRELMIEEANKNNYYPERLSDMGFNLDGEKTYELNHGEIEMVPAE